MEENERVLSGLTAALKSGYKYFYVPVPDDFNYSIEVLGIDDKYIKREFDRQEKKKADLEERVGLIRELRDKGYNYREIANKLHYKSPASILYILRKALKYGL